MKLSKKLKRKLKKRMLLCISSIAIVLMLIAGSKLADFSIQGKTKTTNKIAATNRIQNTEQVTYIYDAQDFSDFRNSVNAENTYEGKTVYLMNDIDLSTICSASLGSWTPIGDYSSNTNLYFAGTFNGNYHKIENIYINSTSSYQGLFGYNKGTIQNIIINSGTIKGRNFTGSIAGVSTGIIDSCGNRVNVNSDGIMVGGIVGQMNKGNVSNCYNLGNVTATGKDSYSETFTGGIVGFGVEGRISNCYNKGAVKSSYTFAGGILGGLTYASTRWNYLANCYNTGTVSASNYTGSIIANVNKYVNLSKCYYTSSNNYYGGQSNGSPTVRNVAKVTTATLQTYTVTLGSLYTYDVYNQNSGYPVLVWQNNRTMMSLNKNQTYIKMGENIKLNVVEETEVGKLIGNNYSGTNFTWSSTNEDVATVNSEGMVTGLSDGYTTIYAYHEESGMYAMCIVNVAKEIANPQIETGNGYSAILKSDGTVWTIGNNKNGTLGNGTNENSNVPVQVKIDEDTTLENIVKIACRNRPYTSINKRWKDIWMGLKYIWTIRTK